LQARISPRKNAHRYDELASGLLVGEYDGTGALIEETVWLGDIPVATLRPNGATVSIYYVHSDQLNTPRQITRPSDNTAMWTWNSASFGTDAANPNPAGAGTFAYNLRFPGQAFDGHVGLHQNGFRDYDPAAGRYSESDPVGLRGGSYSTYAYVSGNPMRNIDPLGLFNPTKGAVAATNGARGANNVTTGALMLIFGEEMGPADYALALWKIKSGWTSIKRGAKQWNESICEKWSDAAWKNFYGLLPFGEHIDDPREPSPLEYYRNLPSVTWDKLLSEIGTLF